MEYFRNDAGVVVKGGRFRWGFPRGKAGRLGKSWHGTSVSFQCGKQHVVREFGWAKASDEMYVSVVQQKRKVNCMFGRFVRKLKKHSGNSRFHLKETCIYEIEPTRKKTV